jgi:L-alanine-DL-glutamate epimerase-like enolase superfamily enzyme
VPHAWSTDLLTASTLHFDAWLEDAPFIEFNTSQGPLARELFASPIRLDGGFLAVPTAPGVGTEPDPAAIKRFLVT